MNIHKMKLNDEEKAVISRMRRKAALEERREKYAIDALATATGFIHWMRDSDGGSSLGEFEDEYGARPPVGADRDYFYGHVSQLIFVARELAVEVVE